MPEEPKVKRVVSFIDGQNLFYAVKKAYGYKFPNYDPKLLSEKICSDRHWKLKGVHFYTGVPKSADDEFWHHFWTKKLAVMGTRNIETFSRPLRYRHQTVSLPSGESTSTLVGQEKGIDIRIALDVVRLALAEEYDIALIFSQDQDLSEAADEVKKISQLQNRWIKVCCAYPVSSAYENKRGINNADWIKIDRKAYDACLDPIDYRPTRKRNQ